MSTGGPAAMTAPILNLDAVELIDLAERARQRGTTMPEGGLQRSPPNT